MTTFPRIKLWLSLLYDYDDEAATLDSWRNVGPCLKSELAAAIAHPSNDELLALQNTLRGGEVTSFFEYLCSDSGPLRCHSKEDRVDPNLLHRTLQQRVVGALLAHAACNSSDTEVVRMAAEAVNYTFTQPIGIAPLPAQAAEGRIRAAFDYLRVSCRADVPYNEVQEWAFSLLRAEEAGWTGTPPIRSRRCPVLIYRDGHEGAVGWLVVDAVPSSKAEFFADPEAMPLVPFSRTFLQGTKMAMQAAWAASGGSDLAGNAALRWRIQLAGDAAQGRLLLEGGSHGAALAVALVQLMRDEPLDVSTALTMTIDSQGIFGPVDGVYGKSTSAFNLRNADGKIQIQRVVVHPSRTDEARAAAAGAARDPLKAVLACRALEEFLPEASGILGELRQLLEGERGLTLQDVRLRTQYNYPDWPAFEQHCVPVRVRQRDSQDGTGGSSDGNTLNWSEALGELGRESICGPPGSGKTTILWLETARRCGEALAALGPGSAVPLREVRFSCFLRAAELAEALAFYGTDDLPAFAAFLAVLRTRHQLSETAVEFVAGRVRSGHCLVAIDGLDETPMERQVALEESLRKWIKACPEARFVLASRQEWQVFSPSATVVERHWDVQPLEKQQIWAAIRAHFLDAPDVAKAFWDQVGGQSALRHVLASPLLLRIACNLARESWQKRRALPQWGRRTQLYEAFLQNLTYAWAKRPPIPAPAQQALFLDCASDIALELLSEEMAAPDRPARNSAQIVNNVQQRYPAMAGRAFIDDLCGAGVLMYAGNDRLSPSIVFLHRTFGEYLAARALARQADHEGWNTVSGKVNLLASQPAWREVVLFLAGRLSDPVLLLELLADRERDDEFRHRLALACECLAEIPPEMHS